MKPVFEDLYKHLLADLHRNWQLELPVSERTECCYRITLNYWYKLKELFMATVMVVEEDEIEFFKSIKPLFTSHIEYYLVLNQGLLFIPEDVNGQINYWEEERKRYKRFCDRNLDFIRYYEEGDNGQDGEYFLQRNNRMVVMPQERIYEDQDCRSSHDHVVRGLLANSRYYEFVQEQLAALVSCG